jgi:hypothetical protein
MRERTADSEVQDKARSNNNVSHFICVHFEIRFNNVGTHSIRKLYIQVDVATIVETHLRRSSRRGLGGRGGRYLRKSTC